MSGHPTYVLLCDGRNEASKDEPECWREWKRHSEDPVTRTLTDIRTRACGFGWRHVVAQRKSGPSFSGDFCPSCVEGGAMARVVAARTQEARGRR